MEIDSGHFSAPNDTLAPLRVWVLTEGIAGTENQCLGVAEALAARLPATIEVKRIGLRQPWRTLSPYIGLECAGTFTPGLNGPWPDLLIASGRKSIAASRYIKKKSKGKTFTVQIQDPRVAPHQFDLVAVPQHDPTRGRNVIVTTAAPNRITPEKLAEAATQFAPLFSHFPLPRIAVLIGGPTKKNAPDAKSRENLAQALTDLAQNAALLITFSRRTDQETKHLISQIKGPSIYIWNGTGNNPYMGMLAHADYIIATNDSTSMLSEAASTGKPAYAIPFVPLTGRQKKLLENLIAHGAVREWTGTLAHTPCPPLRDAERMAEIILEKLGKS